MTHTGIGRVAPGVVNAADADRALHRVRDYLAIRTPTPAEITIFPEHAGDGELVLPREAVEMFAAVLSAMANGQGVQIIPVNAELTTQEAADFLRVSRPYLIKLLEQDEIPYRRVGRHRRIEYGELVKYKRKDELGRKQAADELTQLDEELGLVD